MKSYCTIPGVGSAVGGISKMLKFYDKVFYVMGKALSGELSCPCDRSFLASLYDKHYQNGLTVRGKNLLPREQIVSFKS